MRRVLVTVAVVGVVSGLLSCAAMGQPCATTDGCGDGRICVAGACRDKARTVKETGTHKLVLEPKRVSVVSSKGPERWTGADVPLGRSSEGRMVLLLGFDSPFSETSRIVSAYLVLEPMPGETPSTSPVPFEVARVLEPWSPEAATWSRLPRLSPALSTGLASNWAGRSLMVEVTAMVQRWCEHRDDDHGVAIVAEAHDPLGASYALGTAGGRGPRLEVYLR